MTYLNGEFELAKPKGPVQDVLSATLLPLLAFPAPVFWIVYDNMYRTTI